MKQDSGSLLKQTVILGGTEMAGVPKSICSQPTRAHTGARMAFWGQKDRGGGVVAGQLTAPQCTRSYLPKMRGRVSRLPWPGQFSIVKALNICHTLYLRGENDTDLTWKHRFLAMHGNLFLPVKKGLVQIIKTPREEIKTGEAGYCPQIGSECSGVTGKNHQQAGRGLRQT